MAQAAITPARLVNPRVNPLLPAFTLWWREIVRFYRQPTRVVGVIVSPLLFWNRQFPALFFPRCAHHDRALHFDFHHDVCN
jgi:hypothetical protein